MNAPVFVPNVNAAVFVPTFEMATNGIGTSQQNHQKIEPASKKRKI